MPITHTLESVIKRVNLLLAILQDRIVSVRPCKKPRVELASYVAQQRPSIWKNASCIAICVHMHMYNMCVCVCVFVCVCSMYMHI